ncbi:glucodextranase DOMON-like domain-containing protein [Deinococcus sp. MIMF12]|uniref:Glucodextranase DOMON-like domain-containing protein n=1 Tax=Deinococcus rhizophilus TaxID=3049544 RepID=A0ABT7JKB3_9DEIO|nr:glucodextranase DOMON-like domain-containing protein [Deinococcus rhizophilus]MDL2344930.1 glucodextranase DOMON-like domain-containing protein [Deinococcus rhizophilus]
MLTLLTATLLTGTLLSVSDPAGDARGDGGYVLPRRPAVSEAALDLRSFQAGPAGDGMRFTVGLERTENPWNAPSGFSANVTDIFVGGSVGGERELADLGLGTGGPGWTYHLRVTGFGSALTRVAEAGAEPTRLQDPSVRLEGTRLVIDAAVPPGRYAYWVTSSVYSPLTPAGVLRPVTTPGPAVLQAGRTGSPVPVDVLAPAGDVTPYTRGTLAPVGRARDTRALTLGALGGLGLLAVIVATLRSRRSPA